MEIEELEIVQLELKYCERCGGLWLRLRGSQQVYCGGCAEQVASLPVRGRKGTGGRLAMSRRLDLKSAQDKGRAWPVPSAEGGNV